MSVTSITPQGPRSVDPPEFNLPEPVRVALEMQREVLWDAMVIVETVAAGIAREYDCQAIGNPDFERTLKVAHRMLDQVACKIDIDDHLLGAATDPDVLAEMERRRRRAELESGS